MSFQPTYARPARYHNRPNFRSNNRKSNFVEDKEAAFFLGKLNKHHDREQVYNQLKKLTREFDFYIAKFDMPNGPNGRGNNGFAFIHCKTREQAQRIIAKGWLKVGNQECEVKPYGGRDGNIGKKTADSTYFQDGRESADSGYTFNPLKSEIRSRLNSGISKSSDSGNITRNPSESQENTQDWSVLSETEIKTVHNSDSQTIINLRDADSESDQWIEEQTRFVMSRINIENQEILQDFVDKSRSYMGLLLDLQANNQFDEIQQVQRLAAC